jgi:hypothetical protein
MKDGGNNPARPFFLAEEIMSDSFTRLADHARRNPRSSLVVKIAPDGSARARYGFGRGRKPVVIDGAPDVPVDQLVDQLAAEVLR